MRVLVLGGGGREHAICWKLKRDHPELELFCAPGNGGIGAIATLVPVKLTETQQLLEFAVKQKIDLTIVGPELPLSLGIVDLFQAAGLKAFGPTRLAAEIETSKAFAKDFMARCGIPTASYQVFTDAAEAIKYIEASPTPIVVKADGLAAGKGVVVCSSHQQAIAAVKASLVGDTKVVIEECLVGEELSLMAFVDGETVIPMPAAQDHKRAFDQDQGPNTGGMGAYAPIPHISGSVLKQALDTILVPTAKALVKEGRSFTGVLYAGLMLTEQGLKVIEFNARFGDPETQVVLPCLDSDLLSIILACVEHRLASCTEVDWNHNSALAVVLASGGYPNEYEAGKPISGVAEASVSSSVQIFHAGTAYDRGQLVTAGGRVLAVVGLGSDLTLAQQRAYQAVSEINFQNMHYRHDIGARALAKTVRNHISN
ncbi:MAG TPA: phosphoribosylamine--glycine ligase [Firmicutes bacterium]|nr:phosphoribosylamine--glycine ligase [Bacillota bacterium]